MSLFKSAGTLAIGNAFAQGINIIGVLALSRFFSPDKFGVYALVLGVAAILSAVSSMRYEVSILLPRTQHQAELALIISLLLSGIVNVVAFIMLASFVLMDVIDAYFLAAIPVAFFLSLINIASFQQNRNQQYFRIVLIQVVKAATFVSVAMTAGMLGYLNNGLIVGMLAANGVPVLCFLISDFQEAGVFSKKISRKRMIVWCRKHKKFLYYSMPAVFVNNLALQVPVFGLASLYGTSSAGMYGMISRLILGPVNLVSGAVNKVYMREVSSRLANKRPVFSFSFDLVKKFTPLGMLASLAMLAFFHFDLVEVLLGSEWKGIDAYATVMVPVFLTAFVAKSVAGFAVLNRNEVGLIYQFLLLFSTGGAILLARFFSSEDIMAFGFISFALAACFFSQVITVLKISKNYSFQGGLE